MRRVVLLTVFCAVAAAASAQTGPNPRRPSAPIGPRRQSASTAGSTRRSTRPHRRSPASCSRSRTSSSRPPRRPRRGSSSTTTTSTCRRGTGNRIPSAASPTRCGATPTSCARTTSFGVMFDTFHDKRNGYIFYANAIGGLADSQVTDEGPPNVDWNTVWDVRTGELRRRLDDRDGHPLQVAALPARAPIRSGASTFAASCAGRTNGRTSRRCRAPDDVSRLLEDLVGRHARGPAGAVGQHATSSSSRLRSPASRPTTR